VNKEIYIDILRHLREAVRRKHLNECRTKSWFLLHDNAPGHRSVLVKDFLANHNATILEHPPYCPDLTPAGYYLFNQLKSALKGQCFCDATDIIKKAMEDLTRLSQNGFQECFQHLNSHGQTCIVAQGDHFEG
jgi:transposase